MLLSHPVIHLLRGNAVFRRLLTGVLISSVGDMLAWLCMAWFVLERGGSGQEVGFVLLCFALPAALTAAPIGRLLDHAQPRTVMLIDNIARAFVYILIPVLHWLGVLSMPMLYGLAVLAGALAPATQVGMRMLAPALLRDDERDAGNAALGFAQQVPLAIAPLMGGLVTERFGAPVALLVNGLSFAALCWALLALPDLPRAARERRVDSGGRTLALPFQNPITAATLLLSAVFFFTYGPMEVALPIFTKNELRMGASAYGAMWAVLGVGTLIGAALAPWLARWSRRGLLLIGIMFGWGAMQAAISLAPGFVVVCAVMFAGGVLWGPYIALETGLIQRSVPAEIHGRMFGARSAWLTPTAPLGTALGGLLLGITSAGQLIAISGLLCMLAALLALAVPALRARH